MSESYRQLEKSWALDLNVERHHISASCTVWYDGSFLRSTGIPDLALVMHHHD